MPALVGSKGRFRGPKRTRLLNAERVVQQTCPRRGPLKQVNLRLRQGYAGQVDGRGIREPFDLAQGGFERVTLESGCNHRRSFRCPVALSRTRGSYSFREHRANSFASVRKTKSPVFLYVPCLPGHARRVRELIGGRPEARYAAGVRNVGLECGEEMRTAVMQAGIVKGRLTFRHVFTSTVVMLLFVLLLLERASCVDRLRSRCKAGGQRFMAEGPATTSRRSTERTRRVPHAFGQMGFGQLRVEI